MSYLQILRLDGDLVSRKSGESISIDPNSDAAVTNGGYPFSSLYFSLGARRASESIGIHTAIGEVEFPDGLEVGKKLVVAGKEIGVVASSSQFFLSFDFNYFATSAHIQTLIRSVIYTDTSPDAGFIETSTLRVTLSDTSGSYTAVNVYIGDSVQGTDENDIFAADQAKIGKADELDGGLGDDTLDLVGGGGFNLHQMKRLASIETIRGSSASDAIFINANQLEGIKQFHGNGYGETKDILSIFGSNIDLTMKEVSGFDIYLRTAGAIITIDNIDLAKNVYGYRTANDTLIITKGILSEAERALLHRNGIDTITTQEDGQTTTHRPPQLSGIAETVLDGQRCKLIYLDAGRDAGLIVDEGLLKTLTVSIKGTAYAQESLGVDSSNGVSLLGTMSSDKTVWVDGVQIGTASGFGANLSIEFNASATPARVQKLIQSLTYLNDSGGPLETRTISLSLVDVSSRETKLEIGVQLQANTPPSSVALYSIDPLQELAANDSRICTLGARDDFSSSFTFEILRSDGTWGTTDGRFKIEGNQLKVANGLLFDFEQAQSHTITLKVTDEGGLSRISSATFQVEDRAIENIYGSAGNDVFFGGAGQDTIRGNGGNDKINGGLGKDALYGGAGRDIFQFTTKASSTNVDKIADYKVSDDSIQLDNKYFTKLGSGSPTSPKKLASAAFWKGAKAHDASDRIIYDSAYGKLYYDADGTGSSKQVLIGTMSKGLKMSYAEFFVI